MILLTAVPGCMPTRVGFNQRNFALETSRNIPQHKNSKDMTLGVQSFSIDTTFNTKSFVYRKTQSEYENDFYNQFLINPDDMITEKTRGWLSESGLFKWVLEAGSYADATHILEGNIIAMYGDFRDESLPKATMIIRFFIIKESDKSITFGKTYEAQSTIESRDAESLVEAFDNSLTDILTNLEHDLQEQL
jgi:ABC-type uncharacterized transport system auxiliary subunit